MGQRDVSLKQYLSDETRFADLINGMIGGGKPLVSAENLIDKDPQIADPILPTPQRNTTHQQDKYKKILPRHRDLIRKAMFGVNFVVIGIENQELTHYLMPVRCMGYDAREYERQAVRKGKQLLTAYKEKKIKLSDAEFLSRFRKDDKLHPCITLVLYFGDQWDGATSLHELLDPHDIPREFRPFINDYRVHILQVKQLKNTDIFHSDLKLVFDSIRFADDKEKFREHVLLNPAFQDLDDEAYCIIQQYCNSKELQELEETISIRNEGGTVNMCKAITELIAEGREEGLAEGIEKGMEKGIEKGKHEERTEIIRAMYLNGLDRNVIIQVTSVSEEELKKILEE